MKLTFKKISIIWALACLLLGTSSFGQVPQKFNYQGIARDTKGNPMSKQQLSLKLSVLPTEDATVSEYEETQQVTTNEFGLYTLQIGNGTIVTGEMKDVKWETGNKYIRVAIDPQGGTNYQVIGTSQLLSVPYAIYADKAGMARESVGGTGATRAGGVVSGASHAPVGTTADNGFLTRFTGYNTIEKSVMNQDASGHIAMNGPAFPTAALTVNSACGIQPLVLESPIGCHNLIRENGANRGYFGSYVGSPAVPGCFPGVPFPGATDVDFDAGTSGGNPTGKFHLTTQTIPRMTIMPNAGGGRVGINNTTPNTGPLPSGITLNPNLILDVNGRVQIRGGAPQANYVLTSVDNNGYANWQNPNANPFLANDWHLTGNTVGSTGKYLGTNDNYPLQFIR